MDSAPKPEPSAVAMKIADEMSDDGSNTPAAMSLRGLLHEAQADAARLHNEWQAAVHRRMALRDALDAALAAELEAAPRVQVGQGE